MKKTPRAIIILQKCTKNHDHSCTVSEIWYVTDVTVGFHFGLFFTLLFPSQPKISNFNKMKKTPGVIIILHMRTKNYDQIMHGSWDRVHNAWAERQMDRQMDEKNDIDVDAPPKKKVKLTFFVLPAFTIIFTCKQFVIINIHFKLLSYARIDKLLHYFNCQE